MTLKPIQSVYIDFVQQLKSSSIETPELDVLFIIRHVLDEDYVSLLGQSFMVSDAQYARLDDMVQQRIQRTPLAYILKSAEFNGRSYFIDEGVLIPRPETEELIVLAMQCISWVRQYFSDVSVVELGVGSGIISIELASQFQDVSFFGWDILSQAILVATQNIESASLTNISLFHADFFQSAGSIVQSFRAPVNIFVSNPPYVSQSEYEELAPDVLCEPREALVASDNGCQCIFDAIEFSFRHQLVFISEMGVNQSDYIRSRYPEAHLYFIQDISKRDRFLIYIPNQVYEMAHFDKFIDQLLLYPNN